MALTTRTPYSPAQYKNTSPTALLHHIEHFLLGLDVLHNFNQFDDFRRGVRILSRLLPLIEKTLKGADASSHLHAYLLCRIAGVRQELQVILASIVYYAIVLHWTPLRTLWCRIYLNSRQGVLALATIRKMSLQVISLSRGSAMATTTIAEAYTSLNSPDPIKPTITPGLSSPSTQTIGEAQRISLSSIRKSDRILFVMGATGAGKSTFINTAIGRQLARSSDTLEPCTQDLQAFRYVDKNDSRNVVFIDTPGFDESEVNRDAEILSAITQWLNKLYERDITPSGILYLHSLSATRFSNASTKNMMLFSNLIGKKVADQATIVGTMGDTLDPSVCQSRLDELSARWHSAIPSITRITPFDNTQTSAWEIIDGLEASSPPLVSKEMVRQKKPLMDTTVGQYLLRFLETIVRRIRKLLSRVIPTETSSERTLKKLLEDALHQIDVLRSSRGKSPQKQGRRGGTGFDSLEPFDISHAQSNYSSAYRLVYISNLDSQLQHLVDVEQYVSVPHIRQCLQHATDILKAVQNCPLVRTSVIRLLQDLCLLLNIAMDTAATDAFGVNDPFHYVWSHLNRVLEDSKESVNRIASSDAAGLDAYQHLTSCWYDINNIYSIIEVDARLHPIGQAPV